MTGLTMLGALRTSADAAVTVDCTCAWSAAGNKQNAATATAAWRIMVRAPLRPDATSTVARFQNERCC
jgi:hypothetical protein